MSTSFEDYANRRKSRWSASQRAAYEVAEQVFSDERESHLALGADLAARRNELNLSQPRLAELSGVQQSEISRIERGVANPTLSTIDRLSRALGLRVVLTTSEAPDPHHVSA